VKDNNLVSALILPSELTTAQALVILGNGGKIKHKKLGYKVWLNGSRLYSDHFKFIEALPQFIFNADIKWVADD